jgi:hypothetical protein
MKEPLTFDYCPPPCGRRITDDDMSGCETPSGQRYCMIHLPREAHPELYDEWHGEGPPEPRALTSESEAVAFANELVAWSQGQRP